MLFKLGNVTLVPTTMCLSPGTNRELSVYPVVSVLIGCRDVLKKKKNRNM